LDKLTYVVAIGAVVLAHCASTLAIEGMWQPNQLADLSADLQEKGLALDPATLQLDQYPFNAVVSLGFCTASFVSPLGLVATNHHCAYGTISYNATEQKNWLRDGFLAKTIGEDLPGEPTLRVYVTQSIKDVSAQIRAGMSAQQAGLVRYKLIDQREKEMVAECERDAGFRCDVYAFHGGAQYFLVKQLEIRDVRLAYAPPEAIGKFGGDVDNWMWPRHTGDFSFLRAYVGPDGKPADYSPNNVPYRPKSYLKVASMGVKDGDFVMIAGYPGRTNRYRLSDEVDNAIRWQYPTTIRRYTQVLDVLAKANEGRPAAALKYASQIASLNNGMKNFAGNLDNFKHIDAVAIKAADESAIMQWSQKQPGAQTASESLKKLKLVLQEARSHRDRDLAMRLLGFLSIPNAAQNLYRINLERTKPDAEREAGFQARDEVRVEGRLKQLDRSFDRATERALATFVFSAYLDLPAAQRVPEIDAWLQLDAKGKPKNLPGLLDAIYTKSALLDASKRLTFFRAGQSAIEKSNDPALQMAVKFMPAILRFEAQTKTQAGDEAWLRPEWMQARIAYKNSRHEPVYPDANSSLRITYGNVQGYAPQDGLVANPFTTLDGIVMKNIGADPFDATKSQLAAIAKADWAKFALPGKNTVPVNFLSDLDITGGNSGSPTLNAKGELVGLAFDGNYEAISSGWIFNPKMTRTIHVDIRYMLWIMSKISGADNLLKEMGVP
jgi:Peptidase S46